MVLPTQQEAIGRARDIARYQQRELFIHRRDGRIQARDSHGNDPFPPSGKEGMDDEAPHGERGHSASFTARGALSRQLQARDIVSGSEEVGWTELKNKVSNKLYAPSPYVETKIKEKKMKFELYKDIGGEYRWRLKASNGKTIADSGEGYRNKSDCEHGINLVKRNALSAPIEDLT